MKKQFNGYLLPAVVDPSERISVCVPIPNDLNHLLAFLGQLDMLAYWWTWERDDAKTGTEVAQVWREIVAQVRAQLDVGEGCADMAFDVRQNPLLPCKLEKTEDGETWEEFADLQKCPPRMRIGDNGVPEYSTDDGETWTPIDRAPIPPRPVPPEGQSNRCIAAANAVQVYVALYADVQRYFHDEVTILLALGALIALVLAVIGLPLAFGAAFTAFSSLWGALSTLTSDDFNSDVQDELQCILYCHSSEHDGVVTFDYLDIVDELATKWTPIIDVNIWSAINYLTFIIAEEGINRAGAVNYITEADCSDCECEVGCGFLDLTETDGGFVKYTHEGCSGHHFDAAGTWVSGQGWTSENVAGTGQIGLRGFCEAGGSHVRLIWETTATGICTLEIYDKDTNELLVCNYAAGLTMPTGGFDGIHPGIAGRPLEIRIGLWISPAHTAKLIEFSIS